jgi:hypothetical protein
MGAYQTSGSLVLVVLALLAGQATGVIYLSVLVGLLIGLAIAVVDVILFYFAVRAFNCEQLLTAKS